MSTMNKEFVLATMRSYGKAMAQSLQSNAFKMTGTELNSEKVYIPDFIRAREKMNMLERPIGFVCKSSAGRVVKLIQPYDSTIYTGEPEELQAQWGFIWSDDPKHALEYVAISTSPFMIGNCCIDGDEVYRSTMDNNVWRPVEYSQGWEKVEVTE